jgi:hypothetical protein
MAIKKGFTPSQNFILHAVGKNYTKALKVAEYHYDALIDAALGGDPDYVNMRNLFKPHYDGLIADSSAKDLQLGQRIGKTASLKTLLKKNLIQTELPAWQLSIQGTYNKKSAEYKAFFPFGNKSFLQGTIDNKIKAVKTLRDACNADSHVAVNALGATIGLFYTLLVNARSVQEGKKSAVKTDAGTEKDTIYNMCVAQFANFGGIVFKNPDNSTTIESFFDLVTLQDHHHSTLYEGTVHPLETKKVLTHKFTLDSTIVVTNTGDSDFEVWVAESAKDKIHPEGITIPAHTVEMIVPVKNIGDTHHRILMIKDLDTSADAAYEIEVGDKNSSPLADPHD